MQSILSSKRFHYYIKMQPQTFPLELSYFPIIGFYQVMAKSFHSISYEPAGENISPISSPVHRLLQSTYSW